MCLYERTGLSCKLEKVTPYLKLIIIKLLIINLMHPLHQSVPARAGHFIFDFNPLVPRMNKIKIRQLALTNFY